MQPISSTKVDDCAACSPYARGCTTMSDVGSVNSCVNSVMLHKHSPLTGSRRSSLPAENVTGLRQTVACVTPGDGHRKLGRTDNVTLSHNLNVIHLTPSHDHRRPITISGNTLSTVGLWSYELCTHEAVAKRFRSCQHHRSTYLQGCCAGSQKQLTKNDTARAGSV